MDMLAVLGRQFHAAQQLVRARATRNPNEMIENEATLGRADRRRRRRLRRLVDLHHHVRRGAAGLHVGQPRPARAAWDPYPFILLNLFLSMLAALQAPVIMMSQNRQDTKDRLRGELDFDVNRRAESEIQGLARKLNQLQEQLGDVEELLRPSPRSGRGARRRLGRRERLYRTGHHHEAARLLSQDLLAPGRARARAGHDQPGLLAARPADLPARHRRVRDPVHGVHDRPVLPRRQPAAGGGGRRGVRLARREELPGLLHQRHHAAARRADLLRRHPALARAALFGVRGSAQRRDARQAAEGPDRRREADRQRPSTSSSRRSSASSS